MMWKVVLVVLSLAALAICEEPEKVTVCDLKADPPAFNHKLVQVTSFLSHGFEDFTLQDPSCDDWPDVWLEYGGKAASGTMYCCGVTSARTRTEQIEVENVPVSLADDDNFRKLDKLLEIPGSDAMAHAVIVGRFFSGREVTDTRGKHWGGYGHMGCCSLLVIQQVVGVDPHDRGDLDYESYADPPGLEKLKCGGYRYLTPIQPYQDMLQGQKDAESGVAGWALLDPQRVAVDGLAKLLKIDPRSITTMKESRKSQGKIVYRWHSKGKPAYTVVVARPYWLSFYSQKESKVAWVLAAAIEECGQ